MAKMQPIIIPTFDTLADLFNPKTNHVIETQADSYTNFDIIDQAKGVFSAYA